MQQLPVSSKNRTQMVPTNTRTVYGTKYTNLKTRYQT
jgi:hypothetical protein